MSIKAPIRDAVSSLCGKPASLLMLAVLPLAGCGSNAQQATGQADQTDDVVITEPVTLQADITPEAAQWLPPLAFLPDAEMPPPRKPGRMPVRQFFWLWAHRGRRETQF